MGGRTLLPGRGGAAYDSTRGETKKNICQEVLSLRGEKKETKWSEKRTKEKRIWGGERHHPHVDLEKKKRRSLAVREYFVIHEAERKRRRKKKRKESEHRTSSEKKGENATFFSERKSRGVSVVGNLAVRFGKREMEPKRR